MSAAQKFQNSKLEYIHMHVWKQRSLVYKQ